MKIDIDSNEMEILRKGLCTMIDIATEAGQDSYWGNPVLEIYDLDSRLCSIQELEEDE